MTRQEYFDRAARGIIAQGHPAFGKLASGSASCLYLAPDGSRCAVGFHLEDLPKETLSYFNRAGGVGDIPEEDLPEFIAEDLSFFEALQTAHDSAQRSSEDFLDNVRARMRLVASEYALSTEALG